MLQQIRDKESAVSSMLEYTIITAFMMVLFLTVTVASDEVFLTGPSEILRSQEYLDVANSVSVRVVDLAVLAPEEGMIECRFDLPGRVGVRPYSELIVPDTEENSIRIEVSDGEITSCAYLSGIGGSVFVPEMMSGPGIISISYPEESDD